jgi:hypothetical protein
MLLRIGQQAAGLSLFNKHMRSDAKIAALPWVSQIEKGESRLSPTPTCGKNEFGPGKVYLSMPVPVLIAVDPDALDRYVGVYSSPDAPAKATVTRDGSTLFFQPPGASSQKQMQKAE